MASRRVFPNLALRQLAAHLNLNVKQPLPSSALGEEGEEGEVGVGLLL